MRVNVQQQDLILREKIEEPKNFFLKKNILCMKVNTRSCYFQRKECYNWIELIEGMPIDKDDRLHN